MDRRVDQRREPELAGEGGQIVRDRLKLGMRDDRDRCRGHRRHVVVECLEREGMEIDEVPGNMNCHQLPLAVPVIDVARHESFKQQYALTEPVAGHHNVGARRERFDLADRRFQSSPFLCLELNPALVPEEPVGEHEEAMLAVRGCASAGDHCLYNGQHARPLL
jgi:hypothetical protein